ncbi:MAG TPA: hypothetical protein VLN61_12720 [Pseudolabrys sp.]|nr:hypothetical protein [Pseudolabrys sp.]
MNLGDLGADLSGRFAGLRCQRLDLGGDHRKAASGLARTRRLDVSIECEQFGLRCDIVDHGDDVADLVGGPGQRVDSRARGIGADDCFAAQPAAASHLFGYLGDCPDHLADNWPAT